MFNPAATSASLSAAWSLPSTVFPLLLLVGGDIVSCALAQLTGGYVVPVTFSFGWVAYAFSALVSVGNGRLMPPSPDCPCTVIDHRSGVVTENKSWILGRITRDFDNWRDKAVTEKMEELFLDKMNRLQTKEHLKSRQIPSNMRAGLCVSFYEPDFTLPAGRPSRDRSLYTGLLVILVQLGIASIPLGIHGDWSALLISGGGTILALLTASLPEWRREKLNCRRNSKRTSILTKPRGQHAIVIIGNGRGLDLQDLAMGIVDPSSIFTRCIILIMAVFWVALLITSSNEGGGIWYLMAVGAIGTVNNFYFGSVARHPSGFGIHLRFKEVIGCARIMDTLFEVEERFPRLGKSMLQNYFPGGLREEEIARWKELDERAEARGKSHEMSSFDHSIKPPLETMYSSRV